MTWEDWVSLIVGVLLILSPFVLGFSDNLTALWTAVIAGAVVAIMSVLQLVMPPTATRA